MKYKKNIKYLIFFSFSISTVFFIYWFKTQAGINLFSSYSLSDRFPFKYLINNVIDTKKHGILIHETFDSITLFDNWTNLWMREEGSVSKEYNKNGIENSRCLLIRNSSNKSWSLSYHKFIEVRCGDIFEFRGKVKLKGKTIAAYAGVASFDKEKKVIQYNCFTEEVRTTDRWTSFARTMVISDKNIKFIRFRLSGVGSGAFRFDNIMFGKKEKYIGEGA